MADPPPPPPTSMRQHPILARSAMPSLGPLRARANHRSPARSTDPHPPQILPANQIPMPAAPRLGCSTSIPRPARLESRSPAALLQNGIVSARGHLSSLSLPLLHLGVLVKQRRWLCLLLVFLRGCVQGFSKSLAMTVLFEIRDKTFFAVAVMTALSTYLGWVAPNLNMLPERQSNHKVEADKMVEQTNQSEVSFVKAEHLNGSKIRQTGIEDYSYDKDVVEIKLPDTDLSSDYGVHFVKDVCIDEGVLPDQKISSEKQVDQKVSISFDSREEISADSTKTAHELKSKIVVLPVKCDTHDNIVEQNSSCKKRDLEDNNTTDVSTESNDEGLNPKQLPFHEVAQDYQEVDSVISESNENQDRLFTGDATHQNLSCSSCGEPPEAHMLGSKVAMFPYSSVEIYNACKPQPTLEIHNPDMHKDAPRLGGLTDGFDLGMNMLLGGDKEDDGGSSKSHGKSGNRKKHLKNNKRKRH
ncbi:GDT1-like protein 5 [Zea mays]|uniref:GDT1-like protein 5 n=2 Tax=Zea mays TaxID=4577 RepID=A0A3L6DK69_MAIZE|nr:GDT1-like protein 5 [Zea mays]